MIRFAMPLVLAAVAAGIAPSPARGQMEAPVAPAEVPPEAPAAVPTPAPDDPTWTAGGALNAFMSSRSYTTIRQLRTTMTPMLQRRYDHDSAPFNGRQGIRLAAFQFAEKDLKPEAKGKDPAVFVATVRSLWEQQGEVIEIRTETVRIARNEQGLWRVASLEKTGAEPLRFKESINGVTALRHLLRAWTRRDLAGARAQMGAAFLKKYEGRDEALRDLIVGGTDPRHVAYQIVSMEPQGESRATARVRLFEASPGRPSPLDGSLHTLRMARRGAPWVLDGWE